MTQGSSAALGAILAFLVLSCGPSTESSTGDGGECDSLLAGDLVITEVMANPAGEDQGNEYVEIYNASGALIQLEGVTLQAEQSGDSAPKVFTVTDESLEAGEFLVFGGILPEFKPAYIDIAYGPDLGSLRNAGGTLSLMCGDREVDTLTYPESTDGHSIEFDGQFAPDAILNDDLANLCIAASEFSDGFFGSPGTANDPCEGQLDGQCLDSEGAQRDIIEPALGDLVITEVMPNPGAVSDSEGEWFELEALASFDLNALRAGRDLDSLAAVLNARECAAVAAGDRLVFARGDDPTLNGGLPLVDQIFSFALTNSNGSLAISGGETLLDTMSWSSSGQGESIALSSENVSPEANDDPDNLCAGALPYGDGDLGTPGEENGICGVEPSADTCMDGGVSRAIRKATDSSDLRISEIMANPDAVDDALGEYLEVEILQELDLNGLQIGRDLGPPPQPLYTLEASECIRVQPGDHVLFVKETDSTLNGGLPDTLIFDANVTLPQSSGTLYPLYVGYGETIVDTLSYDGSDVEAGESLSIDSSGTMCLSQDAYGDGDLGTPGAGNPPCP